MGLWLNEEVEDIGGDFVGGKLLTETMLWRQNRVIQVSENVSRYGVSGYGVVGSCWRSIT